jgi:hypothetical protein
VVVKVQEPVQPVVVKVQEPVQPVVPVSPKSPVAGTAAGGRRLAAGFLPGPRSSRRTYCLPDIPCRRTYNMAYYPGSVLVIKKMCGLRKGRRLQLNGNRKYNRKGIRK